MSGKINSNIYLMLSVSIRVMLSVYESFHKMVKYGQQGNHMLQDLIGLQISISAKASETENWFETSLKQSKFGLQKARINIPIG